MLNDNRRLRGIVVSLLAAFFYGAAAVLTKIGVADFGSPVVGATIAFFVGALILMAASARGLKKRQVGTRKDIMLLLTSGVVAAVAIIAYYAAFTSVSVTVAASISSASPLVTILLTRVFLRGVERVTPRLVGGAVLVVVGVVLVALGRNVT